MAVEMLRVGVAKGTQGTVQKKQPTATAKDELPRVLLLGRVYCYPRISLALVTVASPVSREG